MVLKPTNAHKFMKIGYKRSNTCYSYMFGHPLSGRCLRKNKYFDLLQKFVNQCTCKILNIKSTWYKVLINNYLYIYTDLCAFFGFNHHISVQYLDFST
jgi:hypothetical protein